MSDLFSKYKIIIFALVGFLIAGGVWWGLSGESGDTSLLTTVGTDGATQTQDKALVETLLQLRAVSLSGAILQDPAFTVLRDFGTQIIPEPVGRPNPFAPLPSSVKATTTAQQSRLFNSKTTR